MEYQRMLAPVLNVWLDLVNEKLSTACQFNGVRPVPPQKTKGSDWILEMISNFGCVGSRKRIQLRVYPKLNSLTFEEPSTEFTPAENPRFLDSRVRPGKEAGFAG